MSYIPFRTGVELVVSLAYYHGKNGGFDSRWWPRISETNYSSLLNTRTQVEQTRQVPMATTFHSEEDPFRVREPCISREYH